MLTLKQRLLNYLETLSGEQLDVAPVSASGLPLYLRERYAILGARLFGRKMALALEADDWESGSPGEYGKHAEILEVNLSEPVIFVLRHLPSYARNRMLQMGIAFIVPGSQTFIPNTLFDLRERFPKSEPKVRQVLSPAAQCTVLYHLLRGSLAGKSLKEIAHLVSYSPIMLSKVKDELAANGICKVIRNRRSLILEFNAVGRSLWEQVKPQLNSPVKKNRWVQWDKPVPCAVFAGMNALSLRTMIAADRLPTYALQSTVFQESLEAGAFTECRDAETATARIEVWSYDPQLLSREQTVDPLSLYLSLRNSADERVQQQLEQLIEGVKW